MARTKVQITVDDEILRDVDDICDRNHMNRSWYFQQAVLEEVNKQKMVDSMRDLCIALRLSAERGSMDEKTAQEYANFMALVQLFGAGLKA